MFSASALGGVYPLKPRLHSVRVLNPNVASSGAEIPRRVHRGGRVRRHRQSCNWAKPCLEEALRARGGLKQHDSVAGTLCRLTSFRTAEWVG